VEGEKPKLEKFSCPNPECPDFGAFGRGNLVLHAPYGTQRTYLLRCKTCGRTFSVLRGTPFFRLRTPREKVIRAFWHIAGGRSFRETARALGVSEDSVTRWVRRACEHAEFLTQYLKEVGWEEARIKALWFYIKKRMRRRG